MTSDRAERTRLASVDALRGAAVAGMLLVNNPGDWGAVYAPLRHAAWHGFTPTDLIFPLFLFIAGVSLSLAQQPVPSRLSGLTHLAWRALQLVLLGLLLNLVAHVAMDTRVFRPAGVLQRIGLCVALAGCAMALWSARAQWAAIALLLAAHAWVLTAGGSLDAAARWDHVASTLDTAVFGARAYEWNASLGRGLDPEGVLSTAGALATTMLGVRAGAVLRARGASATATLMLWGAMALALGAATGIVMPWNKTLWTPSYVLWTAGWAALALGAAHLLCDRFRWPAPGRMFGRHAITAYTVAWLLTCALAATKWHEPIYRVGFGKVHASAGPEAASLAFALVFLCTCWAVVAALDARGWRWRI